MDHALNSQKTPHTSPLRASYGMSFVSILMKNDRVIKGFYCSFVHSTLQYIQRRLISVCSLAFDNNGVPVIDINALWHSDTICRHRFKIQDSRFKIFIGITGQRVSFTNRQDNTQNINTKKTHKSISNGRNICTNTIKGTSINQLYP